MQEMVWAIWTTHESHLCVGGAEMAMQVLIAIPRKLEHRFRQKELLEGSCILLLAVGEGL